VVLHYIKVEASRNKASDDETDFIRPPGTTLKPDAPQTDKP
jgi:hypothetical protein